jgi:hypothetical protein
MPIAYFKSGPASAVIDSGNSLMTSPKIEIIQLAMAVGAKLNIMGMYTADWKDLDTMPNITFTMDGNDHVIRP